MNYDSEKLGGGVQVPTHTQQLRRALLEATAQPPTTAPRDFRLEASTYLNSPPLVLVCAGALAISLLLVLRPPFVLLFEYDAKHPRRGTMRLSWFSVCVTVLITLIAASSIPVLGDMARKQSVRTLMALPAPAFDT